MAPRHHVAWDPTTCINEDCEDIRHQQGISNMAPPSPRAAPSTRSSISIITINQTIKGPSSTHQPYKGPSRSSTHQPYKGPSRSSTYLQGSNRVKTMTIMSTSINPAASYCDHCKGHHQVTRLHSSVVGIKDKHQTGVGINDKLQQQSPPLSLMPTTHAPPKSMLPSESLSPFGINGKG